MFSRLITRDRSLAQTTTTTTTIITTTATAIAKGATCALKSNQKAKLVIMNRGQLAGGAQSDSSVNQFMNGPQRDGWLGTGGRAPAAKVEQSSSFETPLAQREASREQRETRNENRESRIKNRASRNVCWGRMRPFYRALAAYRRSAELTRARGRGGGQENMLPAGGELKKRARLSSGGCIRLATTWRSQPIRVQQSELVGPPFQDQV